MLIGVPAEVKAQERRVGLTPGSVHELTSHGHQVLVQSNAGDGIHAGNADYRRAGAKIATSAQEVFRRADLIVKVKEPQPAECKMLRAGQTLFTYLHLAADKQLTARLKASGATCIAYEMVTSPHGGLPLLTPMSRIAGRLSAQAAANCLQSHMGGCGKLMSGGGGVAPAVVTVIGGGVVGLNAAYIAAGMGARVTVLDLSINVLDRIEREFPNIVAVHASKTSITEHTIASDVVIGAVLVPGMAAPKLVDSKTLKKMRKGSVLVDVAIDQGGCFATSRPTTLEKPTYSVDGIVHYCVANMPGCVPHTATHALNHATLPFVTRLAGGVRKALLHDPHLHAGLSIIAGKLVCKSSAHSLKLAHGDAAEQVKLLSD